MPFELFREGRLRRNLYISFTDSHYQVYMKAPKKGPKWNVSPSRPHILLCYCFNCGKYGQPGGKQNAVKCARVGSL